MKIGIDLDHTIINYHHAFLHIAKQWRLVPDTFVGNKKALKQYIQTKYTEKDWMRLQGHVYGKEIHRAELMPGIITFLQHCHIKSIPFVIISHKTQFGHFDNDKTDLRQAARHWLTQQGFFDNQLIALHENNLFFAATREEKLKMIQQQRCTLFIDDLLDLLLESTFPAGIDRIWYAHQEKIAGKIPNTITIINDWQQAITLLETYHAQAK